MFEDILKKKRRYENMGLKGFVAEEKPPVPTSVYQESEIAYHIRPGKHYLSRNYYMDCIEKL